MTFDPSKLELEHYAVSIASALLILVVGRLVSNWAGKLVAEVGERSRRMSPTLVPFLVRLTRVVVLLLALLAALEKVGVQTASFLAVVGSAGLAVGLALKDTVADVASGVVLLVLRPFDVGEAVDIAGTGGVIDAIDIFQTRLTSPEGVPIVLGNSMVRKSKISNFSRAARRRIELRVGIGYGDDIGRAKRRIEQILKNEPRVLDDPASVVNVDSLGDSAVVLLVRCWTAASDFSSTQMDLTRAVKEGFDAEGIAIPFPQRDVHLYPVAS